MILLRRQIISNIGRRTQHVRSSRLSDVDSPAGFTRSPVSWIVPLLLLIAGCDQGTSPAAPAGVQAPVSMNAGVQQTSPPMAGGRDAGAATVPVFVDVAPVVGLDHTFFSDTVPGRYFLPEIMGGGAAWADFDRDGNLDVYLMNGRSLDPTAVVDSRPNRLYCGRPGGEFRQVPHSAGVSGTAYGQGAAAGDFNADGFLDLYLGNYGPNALLVNNGDGTYSNVTAQSGTDDPLWTSSVVWFDADRDDDLDLYVTNYMDVTWTNRKICDYGGHPGYCGPGQFSSVPDHLFLNQSDGSFIEASRELGLVDEVGKGLAVVAADFDGDFTPEIYVANDMTPNFLFARTSAPAGRATQYRECAMLSGCAQSGEGMNEASMGIACADFDRDGNLDLYLTHYFQMKNTLYRNLGNLQFDDVSHRTGVAESSYPYLGFGTVPVDFDRDQFDDLFIANGHVLGPENEPHRMRPQLLRNDAGARFEDISSSAGDYFLRERLARGAAAADYDDDGDLDILVTHLDEPVALLRNETVVAGHFVGILLETRSRVPPVGARVRLSTSEGDVVKSLTAGGSYLSQSDERLLFTVGGAETAVSVEVSWPDGRVQQFDGLPVDRYWRLREGESPWEQN